MRVRGIINPLGVVAALMMGCAPTPEEPAPTPSPEEPTPPPTEEVVKGELRAIEVEERAYVLDFSDEATIYLNIEEPNAEVEAGLFSLVGAEDDTEPQYVSLRRCEPTESSGRWRLFLSRKVEGEEFCEVLRVRLTKAEQVLYTAPFTLRSRNMDFTLKGVRFLRDDNPELGSDIFMVYDSATKTFSGATEEPLADMRLVACFESNAPVFVNGEEQKSGESVQDFADEVVYVVGDKEFRVRLTNFTGLPVISIYTDDRGPVTSKEDWKSATLSINGMGQFDDLQDAVVNIRGRGNTTWGWDKKPYALKFEKKTSVLGMPKHKRWVLLANAMDRTMIRNRVAFKVAQQTSLAWTPRNEFAEIFLNGKHLGCYLVAEHIKVDENRVNITELSPEDNEGEALTGGYLFELDFHFDNEWQWRTPRNIPFAIKSPDEEDLTPEQFQWAQEYINSLEGLLYSEDYLSPERGYANYIDRQSFIDYWLVFEVCLNHEIGNPGSVYMYKDRGGKLHAGPIWDFDWGTFSYNVSTSAKGKIYLTGVLWYGRLFRDAEFKVLAKERWAEIYPRLQNLLGFIDEQEEYLALSAQRNFALWNPATTGGVNGDETLSFTEAVARMRSIYAERLTDINNAFNSSDWN